MLFTGCRNEADDLAKRIVREEAAKMKREAEEAEDEEKSAKAKKSA